MSNSLGNTIDTTSDIVFGDIRISSHGAPFIIAEMSGNHNQSLERALEIVRKTAEAGAQALKIQTYTADTMTLNIKRGEFLINHPQSLWNGQSLYELYQKAHTPWEWHQSIFSLCRELGLIGFSTPFDPRAVDYLEKLSVPLYKIASFENIDLPLIRYVAQTGKPIILSTGMATTEEITEAVDAARHNGCRELVLLKCTSSYPAPSSDSHLRTIPELRSRYRCHVGLSDHTLGLGASLASIALGAEVIERHVTLARHDGGVDAPFSLEPHELKQLVRESKSAWEAIGHVQFGPTPSEQMSLIYRRSIYVSKNIKNGETLTPQNVRVIRPGLGLPPKYYDTVIGKKATQDILEGTALTWNMIA